MVEQQAVLKENRSNYVKQYTSKAASMLFAFILIFLVSVKTALQIIYYIINNCSFLQAVLL